jgi:4-oxalocrotonate tautomerase
MPIIRVELFKGRTSEQKSAFAREVTQSASQTLKCAPADVQVIFQDVEKSEWATDGELWSNKK